MSASAYLCQTSWLCSVHKLPGVWVLCWHDQDHVPGHAMILLSWLSWLCYYYFFYHGLVCVDGGIGCASASFFLFFQCQLIRPASLCVVTRSSCQNCQLQVACDGMELLQRWWLLWLRNSSDITHTAVPKLHIHPSAIHSMLHNISMYHCAGC
jgi:hypothetical protein